MLSVAGSVHSGAAEWVGEKSHERESPAGAAEVMRHSSPIPGSYALTRTTDFF